MLKNFSDKLRSSGKFGGYLADLLQIVSWLGLTVTILGTALVAISATIIHWVQSPSVYASAATFLFLLWTCIGISILRSRNATQTVRLAHDYAYSIILDGGWKILLGQAKPNHPTSPNEDSISLNLSFRNVCAGPIRVKVEEFHIVLDGRANEDSVSSLELRVPRMGQKGIQSGGIRRDTSKTNYSGTARLKLSYGPPEGPFVRTYKLRVKVQVAFDPASGNGIVFDEITDESDIPYVQT